MRIDITPKAPVDASYVVIAADGTLASERILTGTTNQITVTDAGAGGNVTLATPQDIHTGASPQFANLIITGGGDIRPSADSTTALNIANAAGTDFVTFDTTNSRVGIGTTGPGQLLHLYKGSATDTFLRVENTAGTGDFGVASTGIVQIGAVTNDSVMFVANNNALARIYPSGGFAFGDVYQGTDPGADNMIIEGNVGIGTTTPTAYLHLKAGTASASTAPIKLTSGTVNTTPEAGTIEFDGSFFYLSI